MENTAFSQPLESLQERERLLRLTLDNAPIGIVTSAIDGRLLSVNPAFCRMVAYSAEELLTLSGLDITHPDDRAETYARRQTLIAGETDSYELEKRYVRKDGEIVTACLRVGLVRDDAGQPMLTVGEIQDITGRKEAEEQFREREQLLRNTFENAPIGMAIVDRDSHLTHANTALANLLGYSREELERMRVQDITHPEDIRETELNLRQLWEGKADKYAIEKRFERKDGRIITCLSHVSVVRADDGSPLMTIGQILDITERVEAVQEMRGMRTYLSNMIDSMPSMLVAVDGDARITQWNAMAAEITGVPAEEAIGQLTQDLLPVDERRTEQLEEAISSGKPVRAERLTINIKGVPRIFDAMAYPLLGDWVVGAVVRLDDITDRVRMQEMMVQTEKMLSVGGLAAGMAHEINNPLGSILQSCQNIQRRLSEELPANRAKAEELGLDLGLAHQYMEERNILQFLERIQEAGSRASKIVSDMLTFSRRSELHFQPIDLVDLLETAIRLASSDFDLKQDYDIKLVEFDRDFDPELGLVQCDKTEIEQVLLNLIVNAAHAMVSRPREDEPPRISLRTRLEGDYARLEVSDNGPGMEEEVRRRIFEPFYTTKEVGVGTGLGLSVSYFIIYDQHQGSMRVESAPGKGARFIIRLPLRQGEVPQ